MRPRVELGTPTPNLNRQPHSESSLAQRPAGAHAWLLRHLFDNLPDRADNGALPYGGGHERVVAHRCDIE